MWEEIISYFQTSADRWLMMLAQHVQVSLYALLLAVLLAVPAGFVCSRSAFFKKCFTAVSGALRLVPSLAVLLLVLPVMGTGMAPALTALVLLAVPPVLMNTIAGLEGVPAFLVETAEGMGMEERQIWQRVRIPLALPLIMTGVKTAAVEIVASATLAAKIGAGGLGELIFTGIGLFRTEMLVIGGLSVAVLSLLTGVCFDFLERRLFPYKTR